MIIYNLFSPRALMYRNNLRQKWVRRVIKVWLEMRWTSRQNIIIRLILIWTIATQAPVLRMWLRRSSTASTRQFQTSTSTLSTKVRARNTVIKIEILTNYNNKLKIMRRRKGQAAADSSLAWRTVSLPSRRKSSARVNLWTKPPCLQIPMQVLTSSKLWMLRWRTHCQHKLWTLKVILHLIYSQPINTP